MYQLRSGYEMVGPFRPKLTLVEQPGIVMGAPVEPKLTINQIMQEVADYFDTPKGYLKNGAKFKERVMARHIALYLCRELTQKSYPQISKQFGLDHTSALYAWRCIEWVMTGQGGFLKPSRQMRDTDIAEIKHHVTALRERLEG